MLDIEKPTIDILELTPDGSYGKFVVEPLERGYGITLGNGLRRVLLSSLPGTAVRAIRIQDILHEFTTVDGVKEDIVEMILNLKNLSAKIHSADETKILRIEIDTPGVVTAGDIIAGSDVEILNPGMYICTIEKGGSLNMELLLGKGRGYVPAEVNKDMETALGWLAVDSIYTPVRKVNFYVEKTRVGKVTDFDKLFLEVWTDKTLKPDEAASLGARILTEHLNLFTGISDTTADVDIMVEREDEAMEKTLEMSVEELDLSPRSYNCLKRANIHTVSELKSKTKAELKKVRNLGEKSLEEIVNRLTDLDLSLSGEEDKE